MRHALSMTVSQGCMLQPLKQGSTGKFPYANARSVQVLRLACAPLSRAHCKQAAHHGFVLQCIDLHRLPVLRRQTRNHLFKSHVDWQAVRISGQTDRVTCSFEARFCLSRFWRIDGQFRIRLHCSCRDEQNSGKTFLMHTDAHVGAVLCCIMTVLFFSAYFFFYKDAEGKNNLFFFLCLWPKLRDFFCCARGRSNALFFVCPRFSKKIQIKLDLDFLFFFKNIHGK